jgi:Fe-S-cluster-containing dehydrogenase component
MQVGFAIDHRKCIGCHACTVACKAENDVPLGSFRTWVKYVEKGAFPEVRRHFTVLRCNHCDRAPCVEICPVNALQKRPDAIVDLDRDICIGCRSCMQACPYDALYFHAEKGVAEKCHYCAHRVEIGLEPACVIVCPVQAIVSGDVEDPGSRLAQLIATEPTQRRKLEKATAPRVWYVDALPEALVPGESAEPASYLWSERAAPPPPVVAGFEATPDVWTTLDVAHPPAWGWHVWAYLVTKNLAAGAALLAPFLGVLGVRYGRSRLLGPELFALFFIALTSALLVHDLGRPERFWRLLLKPNTRSWLVKGAWILMCFGGVEVLSLGARLIDKQRTADALRWFALPWAVLASGYSAWLFAQCQGRDLWLEAGLFVRLVLRAALLGAAFALTLPHVASASAYAPALFALLAGGCGLRLWAEMRTLPHGFDARRAHVILQSALQRTRPHLILAVAALAGILPTLLGMTAAGWARPLYLGAAGAVTLALLLYEKAWIEAGQKVPLS